MTKFVVDGVETEIVMLDEHGIDYSQDFIGAHVSGELSKDEDGRYIASKAEADWWVKVCADHEALDRAVRDANEEYGQDAVWSSIKYCFDVDVELIPKRVMEALALLKES